MTTEADRIAAGAIVWAITGPWAWSYRIPRAAELYCIRRTAQWRECVAYARGLLDARRP